MKKLILLLIISLWSVSSATSQSMTIYKSSRGVEETTNKLVETIQKYDLLFFETVDHQEIAKSRGKEIPAIKSILFEDPDLVTELVACQPTTALDLPLEILVWEEYGDVYIGYMDPKNMKKRFMLLGCEEVVDSLTKLMLRVTNEALKQ